MDECNEHHFEKDKKCVEYCGSGYLVYKNKCLKECEKDTYLDVNGSNCVDDCNSDQVIDDGKCKAKCPPHKY